MRAVPTDTNFQGMREFYAYDSETNEWWSYEAKFTDGQCVDAAARDDRFQNQLTLIRK
jgi:hypothetical protein